MREMWSQLIDLDEKWHADTINQTLSILICCWLIVSIYKKGFIPLICNNNNNIDDEHDLFCTLCYVVE
ncbi:unnamed protein product [Schistosoma curassoni]|uniref:Uncharacterized protein n=1 Tax=Schistosoma curassoni TaxID=6186 RepID=A0A183JMQ3_9TREM|nr:unnamed protein product [Schistosoma curassoni]